MQLIELCVHDSKMKAYLEPIYKITREMGERDFADACNEPKHAFGRNPADYTLFEMGTFEQDTGIHTSHAAPIMIGSGHHYLNVEPTGFPNVQALHGNRQLPKEDPMQSEQTTTTTPPPHLSHY